MDVLLDARDTKPDNRIRRTSPHPAPTRIGSYQRRDAADAGLAKTATITGLAVA